MEHRGLSYCLAHDRGPVPPDFRDMRTSELVERYTNIKVAYAVHAALTPEVAGNFGPLAPIVAELRKRGVLD